MLKVPCSITLSVLLAFSAAAQTNPGPRLAGCVQKNGDVYTLTDETSHNTVQLRGTKLPAGRHVDVTGTVAENVKPVSGAAEVIDVSGVKRTAGSCQGVRAGEHNPHHPGAMLASIAVIGGVAVFAIIKTTSRLGEAGGK